MHRLSRSKKLQPNADSYKKEKFYKDGNRITTGIKKYSDLAIFSTSIKNYTYTVSSLYISYKYSNFIHRLLSVFHVL